MCNDIIAGVTNTEALEADRALLQNECDIVTELINKHIYENAKTALNQEEYQKQYNALSERYADTHGRLQAVLAEISERTAKRAAIRLFMKSLDERDGLISEFDEELWHITLISATVIAHDKMRFTFRSGTQITVGI